MKKKALITGIGGQDGSYLAEFLLKKNYTVYGILPRRSSPELQTLRIEKILSKIILSYGDILDKSNIDEIIKKIKPHEVYHLAAQSHVGISFKSPFLTTQIDCIGTLNVLESVKAYSPSSKFYNAATSEMYGNFNKEGKINENSIMEPVSPYGVAKHAAYQFVRIYRKSYNLFATNGILFNHESPRRGLNFVTAKIVKGALDIKFNNKKYIELGNLDAKRDWGYAPEYVEGMWKMLQQKTSDDFVLATNETHSVGEFVNEACKVAGISTSKIKTDKRFLRPMDVQNLRGDYKKAEKILGWKPKITFKSLVKIMVEEDINRWEKWLKKEIQPWDAAMSGEDSNIISK